MPSRRQLVATQNARFYGFLPCFHASRGGFNTNPTEYKQQPKCKRRRRLLPKWITELPRQELKYRSICKTTSDRGSIVLTLQQLELCTQTYVLIQTSSDEAVFFAACFKGGCICCAVLVGVGRLEMGTG